MTRQRRINFMSFERIYLLCCLPGHLLHLLWSLVCVLLLVVTLLHGGRLTEGWAGNTVATSPGMLMMLAFLSYGFLVKFRLFRSAYRSKRYRVVSWSLNLVYLSFWAGFWSYFAQSSDMRSYRGLVTFAFGLLIFLACVSVARILYIWRKVSDHDEAAQPMRRVETPHAGQSGGSDNLLGNLASDLAFPAAVAELQPKDTQRKWIMLCGPHRKLWLVLLAMAAGLAYWTFASDTIRLRIVDERGMPVKGAIVMVSWSDYSNSKAFSDQEGRVQVSGSSPYNQVEIHIQAAGHYASNLSLPMADNCVEHKCQIGTVDELTVQIKRKVNPIPMYHYSIRALSPDSSRPLGFDLEKGDWVRPYGNGVVADLTFLNQCMIRNIQRFQAEDANQAVNAADAALARDRYEIASRRIVNGKAETLPGSKKVKGYSFPEPELRNGFEIFAVRKSDHECRGEVRFGNPGDGLQFTPAVPADQPRWMLARSDLESMHLAPESGYQPVWTKSSLDRTPVQGRQVGYFRIRSRLNHDRRVVSAWYGKIYNSNTNFAGAPKLVLDYYLNTDGTRNVEWDPRHNLARSSTIVSHSP
jgi:hypothetical protein